MNSCQVCGNDAAVVVVSDQQAELAVCSHCWQRLEARLPALTVVSLAPTGRRAR